MKRNAVFALCIALAGAGTMTAQMPRAIPGWQSMKIIETEDPIFPFEMRQLTVTTGEARVVINVDENGHLSDWLVVAYTHRPFADAAVAALKHWKFQAARLDGEPVNATSELTFNFRLQGTVVVNQTIGENLEARTLQLLGHGFDFRPHSLRELDRIPTPVTVVNPQYPPTLAARGVKGSVAINFYIDPTGAVRMPAASAKDDRLLSGLAIDALRQWKFEPPTCDGRPVLVRAVQVFNFGTSVASNETKR